MDPRWKELLHRAAGASPVRENALIFYDHQSILGHLYPQGNAQHFHFPENNIIFQMDHEKDYQYQNTMNYHRLLKEKGVSEKLIYYTGLDNGFGMKHGSWEKLIRETADFFNQH